MLRQVFIISEILFRYLFDIFLIQIRVSHKCSVCP